MSEKLCEGVRFSAHSEGGFDPQYALAYAGIANCHSFLFWYSDQKQTNLERAEEASRRAP